jgi:hypothetical protein
VATVVEVAVDTAEVEAAATVVEVAVDTAGAEVAVTVAAGAMGEDGVEVTAAAEAADATNTRSSLGSNTHFLSRINRTL